MTKTAYPKPDRSDLVPNFEKKTPEDIVDIGWNEGVFSDGRPYRVESWRQNNATMLTYFFSTKGLEKAGKEELQSLLEEEDLLYCTSPVQYIAVQKIKDPSGNELWSVNIVAANEGMSYAEDKIELQPYPKK